MTTTDPTAQISSLEAIRAFITAGNAIFTLVSRRTGERRTFKVVQSEPNEKYPKPGYFVRFLHGPDNTSDYRYLGFMFETDAGELRIKGKGESPALAGFRWMLGVLNDAAANNTQQVAIGIAEHFAAQAEFWHAGRCGRCGRLLTTPESVASGIGPVCASRE